MTPGAAAPATPGAPAAAGPLPGACGRFSAAQRQRPVAAAMRRLSWAEIGNALTDLLPGVRLDDFDDVLDPSRSPDRAEGSLAINETFVRTYHPALETAVEPAAAAVLARSCKDGALPCLEPLLSGTAQRAWRSQLAPADRSFLTAKLAAFHAALGAEKGYAAALRLVLGSPRFLFLLDPGSLAADAARAGLHEADGDRTAGLLAAALWGSVPDDRLLAAAAAGKLGTAEGRAAEIDRMLADPRARRGMEAFFAAWLQHNQVLKAVKDEKAFPGFDDALRADLLADTSKTLLSLFFDDNQPAEALLTSPLGHPGAKTIAALGWPSRSVTPGRADLAAVGRSGVATHPAVLAITSKAHATSIVNRGRFVVEKLGCQHIPDPPEDVDADLDKIEAEAGRKLTGREIAERHAKDPSCASCHRFLDPFGMAFEVFDPIGRQRTEEDGLRIDPKIRLDDVFGLRGEFAGPRELLQAMASTGETGRCFASKLAAFVMPVELDEAQSCVLAQAVAPGPDGKRPSMKDITKRFLLSDLFVKRAATP
jgi:hypothetical protein